jgi:hypothetical protein
MHALIRPSQDTSKQDITLKSLSSCSGTLQYMPEPLQQGCTPTSKSLLTGARGPDHQERVARPDSLVEHEGVPAKRERKIMGEGGMRVEG